MSTVQIAKSSGTKNAIAGNPKVCSGSIIPENDFKDKFDIKRAHYLLSCYR